MKKKKTMVGLIDFDGTVVYHVPQGVCPIDTGATKVLRRLIEKGHNIVLWTCRNSSKDNPYNFVDGVPKDPDSLGEAVKWFEDHNIPLYGINEVPDSDRMVGTSRKPLYDFLIDDLNIGTPLKYKMVPCHLYNGGTTLVKAHCVDWEKIEKLLEEKGIL